MITSEIGTGNASFEGDNFGPEVARILRNLANEELYFGDGFFMNLRDASGNKVGFCDMEGDK
jgi:hypothetical protein